MKRRSSPSPDTTAPSPDSAASATELLLQQLVEARRIRLALRRFHHLPDKEPKQLVLAGAIVRQLSRTGAHDRVDRALDRSFIGNLPPASRIDDAVRFQAFG